MGRFVFAEAGSSNACAIDDSGTTACWGKNELGESSPPSGPLKTLSCGLHFCCGIRNEDGSLICWGSNDRGQASPPAGSFVAVSVGFLHGCAIRAEDQKLTCWGVGETAGACYDTVPDLSGDCGQLVHPDEAFVAIAAGSYHSCALRPDQTATCWGSNEFGRGDPPLAPLLRVSTHHTSSCAILLHGTVECWGTPFENGPPPDAFSNIAVGAAHGCGILESGGVRCWGDDLGTALPSDLAEPAEP